MATIICPVCGQGIKDAAREAKKYQRGEPSAVVVAGPDIYHAECFALRGERGQDTPWPPAIDRETRTPARRSIRPRSGGAFFSGRCIGVSYS